ncbi:hypothetical protein AGLY_003832 [Aphis glycines]|uniref:Reverse transcriptase domain-containing protein n=1 Tax=Aphis glycines TaxID=307491 RepID=A0A6G0TZU1_APHGL|nr:hypothetical protein AGLY_003832 [Aphis glycines]
MIHELTTEEIEMAIEMLKNGKELGEDDITAEFYKQAYDSINRESLWNAIDQLGIPAKITRMIRAHCVQNSKCMVKFNSQLSNTFMINTRLKQGDALSQILFNIALKEVVRINALNIGIGVKLQESKTIKLIAYVDNIVLLSESESDLQEMKEALIDESKQMGLTINEEKTKYMILSRKNNRHSNLIVREMNFELVKNFKYLEVELSVLRNNHKEIQNRIKSANKALRHNSYYEKQNDKLSRQCMVKLRTNNRQVTYWKPKSKRPLDRPRQRSLDTVHKDLDMLGIFNDKELKNVNQICRATLPNEHNMTINNNKNKNKFSLRNNINKRNYILSKNNQIEKNALIRRKKNIYMPIANTRTFKRSLTTNTNKRKNIKTTNKQKIKSTLITNACSQTIPSKVKPRKNTSKFTNKNLPINTTTSTSTPVLKSISTIGSLPSIKVPFNMIESHLNKNIDNENKSISDSDDNNDDDDSIFGSDEVNYNTVINDNDDEENNIKLVQEDFMLHNYNKENWPTILKKMKDPSIGIKVLENILLSKALIQIIQGNNIKLAQEDCMSHSYNKENWPTILKKMSDPSTGIKVLEGILLRKALIQMMQGNNIKNVQEDSMSNNYNKENWPTILKKMSDPSTGIKVLEGFLLRKALIQMMQGNNRTNREVLILKRYSCSIDNLKYKYDRLQQKIKTLKNSLKSDRNMRRTSVLNKKAKQFDNDTEYRNVDVLNQVQVNDEAKIDGEDEKHNRPTRTRRPPARLSIYHLYSDSD